MPSPHAARHSPVHPGEILREEFLEPLGISMYRLAKDTGMPADRVGRLVRGTRAFSADTALRLAAYFKTTAEFWMNLQARYDLEVARDSRGIKAIAKIQLKRLELRLAAQDMVLTVSDAALAEIAKAGFDPVYGARPLKRAIQQQVENPIAKRVLEGKVGPKDVVPVDFREGRFTFERTVH